MQLKMIAHTAFFWQMSISHGEILFLQDSLY